jgi:glutamate-1-semialdehyde 2,1-aminomutase
LFDDKGERYIDLIMGSGTHLLGHGFFEDEAKELVSNGTIYSETSRHEIELTDKLQSIFGMDKSVIYCSTGTEATMRAIRAARAYTGKTKILMFSGSWHGGNESLWEEDWSNDRHFMMKDVPVKSMSAGMLDSEVIMVPYNNPSVFEIIESMQSNLAGVIIEPIQGSNPREDMGDFLRTLREVVRDVPLIFDEIITGFRVGLKGVQGLYDIEADIVTYGKVIGGGFPVGVVMGKSEILDNPEVFYGGTFSGNPISCGMGNVVLDYLENKFSYENLYDQSYKFYEKIENILEDYPVQVMKCHSMFRFVFTDRKIQERRDRQDWEDWNMFLKFIDNMKSNGILIKSNGICFLCLDHKEHEYEILDKIEMSLEGFFCNEWVIY